MSKQINLSNFQNLKTYNSEEQTSARVRGSKGSMVLKLYKQLSVIEVISNWEILGFIQMVNL